VIGRALTLALCAAALWGATGVAGAAKGAGSSAGSVVRAQGLATLTAGQARPAAPRRTTPRRKRIRRYCRRAKRRHAREGGSESLREARKRKRLCGRRRARRRPTAAPAPRPFTAPAPTQPGTLPPRPVPPGRYVSVQAREFYYTLSRPLVATGEVTIELRNNGEDPHNLVVSPQGTHDRLVSFADHDPAEVSATNLTLQTGGYYLWCSLEGHEAAGMHATLTVR